MKLSLGGLSVDVTFKDIKNVHLTVHPPDGRVTIAAPKRLDDEAIRLFAISKMGWIKRQQRKVQGQAREPEREYLDGESHYLWGKRYRLRLREIGPMPVEVTYSRIILRVPDGALVTQKRAVLAQFYREQVRAEAVDFIEKWAQRLAVSPKRVRVQRMRTKWGSCSRGSGSIVLNSELAKKPRELLEYVIVHELMHLHEHTHNRRFQTGMDRMMPDWQQRRKRLNELPVC